MTALHGRHMVWLSCCCSCCLLIDSMVVTQVNKAEPIVATILQSHFYTQICIFSKQLDTKIYMLPLILVVFVFIVLKYFEGLKLRTTGKK